MNKIVNDIKQFVKEFDYSLLDPNQEDKGLYKVIENSNFLDFLKTITEIDVYSKDIAEELETQMIKIKEQRELIEGQREEIMKSILDDKE